MTEFLLATNNPGKLREFAELLDGLRVALVTPADLGLALDIAETGRTYADNARAKAIALARAAGLVTIGDDSGLEVEALGGAPGLYSARYAGPRADAAARRQKLMRELRHVPPPRRARFVAAVAVAHPGREARVFEGVCPGEVILEERGTGGFGYDPIFYIPEYGRTMAELPADVKNRISHRGRAVRSALPYIEELLKQEPG